MTRKREIGDFGEEITSEYLENNGYRILDRNYACLLYTSDAADDVYQV